MTSALLVQPQGDHYRKMKIQPIEYITANNISFMAGNIIKYASRYKEKNGAKDIEKIKHYCDLILELEYGQRGCTAIQTTGDKTEREALGEYLNKIKDTAGHNYYLHTKGAYP